MNTELFKLIIGWITCVISIVELMPQTLKSFKKNDTGSLSVCTLLIRWISACCWITYAFVLFEIPMIVSMIVYFLLSTALLILKIIHKCYKKNNINSEN